MTRPKYSIVAPVFNEEETLPVFYERMAGVMDRLDGPSELVLVFDGSRDRSPEIGRQLRDKDPRVKIIDFARNFGHQIAITAGIDYAEGDAVAPRIFLRGFDAEHGQDIAFSAGGVPINQPSHLHGQGYADLGFVIPETVRSVRVTGRSLANPADRARGHKVRATSSLSSSLISISLMGRHRGRHVRTGPCAPQRGNVPSRKRRTGWRQRIRNSTDKSASNAAKIE